MGSRAARTQLKELEKRCARLERQAQQLQEEKQRAAYTEQLLNSICDIFTMMQISSGLRGVGTPDDVPKHSRDEVEQLLQQESSLLSQLTSVPRQPMPETLGVPVLGVSTAAPKTDPLALMKYALCQDVAEAGTITSQQIAQRLSQTVLECSVQLHLVQRPDIPSQACIDRLRELWLQHLSLMTAVMLSGRPEVIEGVSTYNLATLQPDANAMRDQETSLPPLLDLTDDQVQEIIAGAAIFRKLQDSILQQQQQQLQQAGLDAGSAVPSDACGSACTDSSACSGPQGCSSTVSSSTQELSLQRILGDLDHHMRHADRMRVLLQKDLTMRAIALAWLCGSLDWRQITKAAILCWPYPWRARVTAFGQAVSEYAARQGSQQEQGQQQADSSSRNG